MRRIVVFEWVSADGYFAAGDGNLNWVVPDEEQARMAAGEIARFDTALFGRKTYEIFEKFWGTVKVDEAGTVPDPHHPGRRSKEHGTIAEAFNRMTKLVFSRTKKDASGWKNSRLVREFDGREIERMKGEAGGDMIVFGSGSIVSQLTAHAMIDEYQFAICPVVLGSGRKLIEGTTNALRMELVEAKALPSGDLMVRYKKARA